jgi:hypothetical protein
MKMREEEEATKGGKEEFVEKPTDQEFAHSSPSSSPSFFARGSL